MPRHGPGSGGECDRQGGARRWLSNGLIPWRVRTGGRRPPPVDLNPEPSQGSEERGSRRASRGRTFRSRIAPEQPCLALPRDPEAAPAEVQNPQAFPDSPAGFDGREIAASIGAKSD